LNLFVILKQQSLQIQIEDQAMAMILQVDLNFVKIASFTTDDVNYTIEVNGLGNELKSCTCEDFQTHKIICKHLFLANRLLNLSLENVYNTGGSILPHEPITPVPSPQAQQSERELNLDANRRSVKFTTTNQL
jgi:hypothetical protein